ncbi:MAG: redoxin family protein [Xanthomonadales bacterium]|nr:redoxin family protein [Xanthomonadales bacterium]
MSEGKAYLPDSLDWINIDLPPSLSESRGKVVLLFFWTYSNIQSLNMLPVLRDLENEHENGVVVLGIHCAKFTHEENPRNVIKAINRHYVRFPVACDPDYEAWQAYGIEGWPSVVVIDAEGELRKIFQGDDQVSELDELVGLLLQEAADKDIRNYGRVGPARRPETASILKFPTAVVEARGLIYVSDAGNNRILELTKNGRIQRVFGSGNPGFWDGVLANCGFSVPRGLAYADNHLYVADTNNHAIRRINLFNGEVETILGNGKPGIPEMTRSTRKLREVGLMMPVGLACNGPKLYISAAGMSQIWCLDLGEGTVGWLTGTGQPGVIDGEAVAAGFVQPLGLAVGEGILMVADADGSAIREVRIGTGHVGTRIGNHAFDFGLEDGAARSARLQYPMDVAIRGRANEVYIADSFNNKIRMMDLESGQLSTPELEYSFEEPAGMMIAGNTLWVANTNAHEIVQVDLVTRACEVLEIEEAIS